VAEGWLQKQKLKKKNNFQFICLRFLLDIEMQLLRSQAQTVINKIIYLAEEKEFRRRFTSVVLNVQQSKSPAFLSNMSNRHLDKRMKRTIATTSSLSIADTALGKGSEAAALLDGLEVYTVPSLADRHPLTVYGMKPGNTTDSVPNGNTIHRRRPILLLHGRTWSSVPVYHLLGGPNRREKGEESRSLMDALFHTQKLQPYCMDFRGFGGTPADETRKVTPHTCVADVESVLQWISSQHGLRWLPEEECSYDSASEQEEARRVQRKTCEKCEMPVLLGWSQGALIAQLVAQKDPALLSQLILYGSIYDPLVRYPRAPLYAQTSDLDRNSSNEGVKNTYDAAIEDFTIEGSIPKDPAKQFARAALLCDPIKVRWSSLHELNNVDPARVHVPTLVVAGDQDPYCPLRAQQELFCNLGRGADRCWNILSGSDHAIHLLDARARFVQIVENFTEIGRRNKIGSSF
jgi:pimeloyl-ACP methyl ester carboxylesterase